jgi:hypothetical protein
MLSKEADRRFESESGTGMILKSPTRDTQEFGTFYEDRVGSVVARTMISKCPALLQPGESAPIETRRSTRGRQVFPWILVH